MPIISVCLIESLNLRVMIEAIKIDLKKIVHQKKSNVFNHLCSSFLMLFLLEYARFALVAHFCLRTATLVSFCWKQGIILSNVFSMESYESMEYAL